MQTQYQPNYDAEQPLDDVELDIEDAFGEHNIEYWVRSGNKFVPATEDEVAQIHEWERESAARARLVLWTRAEVRPWPARLLGGLRSRCALWMRQQLGQPLPSSGVAREQEQRTRSPIKPRPAGGHDEHEHETSL